MPMKSSQNIILYFGIRKSKGQILYSDFESQIPLHNESRQIVLLSSRAMQTVTRFMELYGKPNSISDHFQLWGKIYLKS